MKFNIGDKVVAIKYLEKGIHEVIDYNLGGKEVHCLGGEGALWFDDFELKHVLPSSELPPADFSNESFNRINKEIQKTTALKNDKKDDKIPLQRLTLAAVGEMCRVFDWASKKYPDQANGDPNYYLGHSHKQLLAAALRHTLAALEGEEKDPESGFSHEAHAQCCFAMIQKQRQLRSLKP